MFDSENVGRKSISAIIFSNIIIKVDEMEINYCKTSHEDPSKKDRHHIDFGIVGGIDFFANNFLNKEEANVFMAILCSILARKSKTEISHQMCQMVKMKTLTTTDFNNIKSQVYKNDIKCQNGGSAPPDHRSKVNLDVLISKDNPFFSTDFCTSHLAYEYHPIVINTSTKDGKLLLNLYNSMKKNFKSNLKDIERLLLLVVEKNKDKIYILKDIKKNDLEHVIDLMKARIKVFYIQSIVDFHTLLDAAKQNRKF